MKLRDFRNVLESSSMFYDNWVIYISVAEHVFCTCIFRERHSVLCFATLLAKKPFKTQPSVTRPHQHAWHRRSSANGRRVRSGNLRFPSRDRSVDEFDHQHVLLEQGNFLARVDLKLFRCEYNFVSFGYCRLQSTVCLLLALGNYILFWTPSLRRELSISWTRPCPCASMSVS